MQTIGLADVLQMASILMDAEHSLLCKSKQEEG